MTSSCSIASISAARLPPPRCRASEMRCTANRASLSASRACSANSTCRSTTSAPIPSATMRGSSITSKLLLSLQSPAVKRAVYVPGGTIGPPRPDRAAFASHGPGYDMSHVNRCVPASEGSRGVPNRSSRHSRMPGSAGTVYSPGPSLENDRTTSPLESMMSRVTGPSASAASM